MTEKKINYSVEHISPLEDLLKKDLMGFQDGVRTDTRASWMKK